MHTRRFAFLVLALVLPALCAAQRSELSAPSAASLAAMQRDAVESVNITLGPATLALLRFMGHFAGRHDPDAAAAMNVLRGVHRVQVRNFRFATDHSYSQTDLEALRSQLTSPGWHQMVQVRNRSTSENVDIYYTLDNHTVTGLMVIAAEPLEFTLVNIVGTMDFNQIGKLRQTFIAREHGRPPLAAVAGEEP